MLLVAVRDLMFRSKIQEAAQRAAAEIAFAPRDAPLADAIRERRPAAVLVDLTIPGVLDEVRAAKADPALRVVGYLGHLQTDLMEEARAAGVDEVLTRGQLVGRMEQLFRPR